MRIQQEIMLGIGGMYALNALGMNPAVHHMNEGHAAFLALERIRQYKVNHGLTVEEAIECRAREMYLQRIRLFRGY